MKYLNTLVDHSDPDTDLAQIHETSLIPGWCFLLGCRYLPAQL